jgi:hypothetical protein|tara:strand:+ start:108 stop:302 length:195 start_codon:yes stop_codon:yes gene_type:complete
MEQIDLKNAEAATEDLLQKLEVQIDLNNLILKAIKKELKRLGYKTSEEEDKDDKKAKLQESAAS